MSVMGEQFNSQAKDKESGFYFYNARHYDGELGRFVTADSVVDGEYSLAGWSRYMYCGGNPVLYKDPSGHWKDQSETHYVKDIDNNTHSINVCRGTVTNGDNLWKIAKEILKKEIKYKLIKDKISNKAIQKKVNLIKKLNELKTDNIKGGRKLITGIHDRLVKSDGIEQGSLMVDVAMLLTGGSFVKNGIRGIQKGIAKATAQTVTKKGVQKLILRNSGRFAKHTYSNLVKGIIKASSKEARKMAIKELYSKVGATSTAATVATIAEIYSGTAPSPPESGKQAVGAVASKLNEDLKITEKITNYLKEQD